MYIPPANAETNEDTLFSFLAANPFGTLVTQSTGGEFVATHLPLIAHREGGSHGVLEGHIAKANSQHELGACRALVIFTGPDAYISPSWYASKDEHGKVVPTWNYVAVHVYGTVRFTSDEAFLSQHLQQLVATHEGTRPAPWAIGDAPRDYIERQMRAIVGIQLSIERIEGKWKMSQNRPEKDIDGVIENLLKSPAAKDRAVADIVATRKRSR
ncbi:MAG TPA: FMN-binding negative transcriptional regulator [Gemmatimonadaceae bacterium]|jgi:transcriptional regulator